MKIPNEHGYAAVNTHICIWTVSGTAKGVRECVGREWDAANPRAGWEAARDMGFRVRRVKIIAQD